MNKTIEKLRLSPWTYRQPLATVPDDKAVVISDLFIWRNNTEWETYFDLINLYALINAELPGKVTETSAEMRLMDSHGDVICSVDISFGNAFKQKVDLKKILAEIEAGYGTFCVIHPETPNVIIDSGSFLAERGYTSFRYQESSLRSYVHGNLDAIAARKGGALSFLGGKSLLSRNYNLQHQIIPNMSYEVGLTNPSSKSQKLVLKQLDDLGIELSRKVSVIKPGGCEIVKLANLDVPSRLVITSNLVMARPVVFKMTGKMFDVFHG